jgi:hypothetical protein
VSKNYTDLDHKLEKSYNNGEMEETNYNWSKPYRDLKEENTNALWKALERNMTLENKHGRREVWSKLACCSCTDDSTGDSVALTVLLRPMGRTCGSCLVPSTSFGSVGMQIYGFSTLTQYFQTCRDVLLLEAGPTFLKRSANNDHAFSLLAPSIRLLKIFFTTMIGFQVPIKNFGTLYVV